MGKASGFMEHPREAATRRPVAERVNDWFEIYQDFPEEKLRSQGARCMDCGVPFCHTGCPVNNLIPDWNDLVYNGRWKEALRQLHSTNNFPEFTGRICPAPCEAACVLGINEPAVTIKQIEKSIVERGWQEGFIRPERPKFRSGKKVAIVGSGPAGLAAAQQLNRAGHWVTVYEKADRIGGLLRYGIPEFKLEKKYLDRRLALMFACAHPAIDAAIRAPLILQAVLGLEAKTIASAFLVSPAAMSKRLVRAKEKIRQAAIPFRIPDREELPRLLDAVLDAVYAAFAEGWIDAAGADPARRDLAEEALFLGRLVTELLPDAAEALGLLALMLHAEARRRARRSAGGEYVPLALQDQTLWDVRMIVEAEALIRRAAGLGSFGRYQLEAALQSAHVYRCRTGHNNWAEIAQLYDALFTVAPSPVVAINRALAIAETHDGGSGLAALPDCGADPRLAEYQPYWAARAELLARTGAVDDARHAYDVAIGLERDSAVRLFLQRRRSALA